MANATTSADLQPTSLMHELSQMSHAQVEARYEGTHFLLVELRDDAPELADGLHENQAIAGSPPRPTAATVATTLTFPAVRVAGARASLEGMDRIQLFSKLSGARHFVLPLFKRKGTSAPEENKLTVGRNRGTDVMLNHVSVSKLHAWFVVDHSGALYLFDAKSLNGTQVNGKSLNPEEAQWLQPMDHLQFGSISAFTCAPLVLRSVVRTLTALGRQSGLLEVP